MEEEGPLHHVLWPADPDGSVWRCLRCRDMFLDGYESVECPAPNDTVLASVHEFDRVMDGYPSSVYGHPMPGTHDLLELIERMEATRDECREATREMHAALKSGKALRREVNESINLMRSMAHEMGNWMTDVWKKQDEYLTQAQACEVALTALWQKSGVTESSAT